MPRPGISRTPEEHCKGFAHIAVASGSFCSSSHSAGPFVPTAPSASCQSHRKHLASPCLTHALHRRAVAFQDGMQRRRVRRSEWSVAAARDVPWRQREQSLSSFLTCACCECSCSSPPCSDAAIQAMPLAGERARYIAWRFSGPSRHFSVVSSASRCSPVRIGTPRISPRACAATTPRESFPRHRCVKRSVMTGRTDSRVVAPISSMASPSSA